MDLAYLLSSSLAPVQRVLLGNLGPTDFLALALVSKPIRATLKEALPAVCYNIDAKLRKFFSNPGAFRKIQAESGTLIGDAHGSFVRNFFGNCTIPNELHLYICVDFTSALPDFLSDDGYDKTNAAGSSGDGSCDGHFAKYTRHGTRLEVFIYDTSRVSLNWQLNQAPSTIMCAFITWNRAYHLFPHSTFTHKEGYLLVNLDDERFGDRWRGMLYELAKDDFKTKGLIWNEDEGVPLTIPRRVGDKYTWTIDLDTSLVAIGASMPVPDYVFEATTFQISPCEKNDTDLGPIRRHRMGDYSTFRHAILRHKYIVMDDGPTAYGEKISALRKRLNDSTKLELLKLPEDERPTDYWDFIGDTRGKNPARFKWRDTPVPEGWTYYDEDLVRELERLWQQYGANPDRDE